MFNLIVNTQSWSGTHDRFFASRVFEYTEPDLESRFRSGGALDVAALKLLPTLFLEESNGEADQVARVGWLHDCRLVGSNYSLEYSFDQTIAPVPNRLLAGFAMELGIRSGQFARIHWSVLRGDLFRSLLRHCPPRRQQPSVFQIADPQVTDANLIAAMMPFHPDFRPVYDALKRVASEVSFVCRRADDIWEHASVMQDVVSLIDRARIVICDCTGRNPNVFYVAGIAHTLGREVILISQNRSDIPFDLQHLRNIDYLNNEEGRTILAAKLHARISSLLNLSS